MKKSSKVKTAYCGCYKTNINNLPPELEGRTYVKNPEGESFIFGLCGQRNKVVAIQEGKLPSPEKALFIVNYTQTRRLGNIIYYISRPDWIQVVRLTPETPVFKAINENIVITHFGWTINRKDIFLEPELQKHSRIFLATFGQKIDNRKIMKALKEGRNPLYREVEFLPSEELFSGVKGELPPEIPQLGLK